MNTDWVFRILTAVLTIASTWLLNRYNESRKQLCDLEEGLNNANQELAVFKTRLDYTVSSITQVSERINGFETKIDAVLQMKPLLEDAVTSIRELRRFTYSRPQPLTQENF